MNTFSEINTTNNPIYISTENKTNNDSIPICRICLDNDSTDSLILPCNCSQGHVHFSCLSEWIRRREDDNFNICEICTHPYRKIGFTFKSKVNNKVLLVIWFFTIFGLFSMFVYTIMFFNKNDINFNLLYCYFLIYITCLFTFFNNFSIPTSVVRYIYRIND